MSPRRKAALWALLPLLFLTPPLLWQGKLLANRIADEQRSRTQRILQLHADAVQRSMDQIEGKLEGLAVFVAGQTAAGTPVDQAKFDTFAAGLHVSSTWIRAFQIVSDGVITHAYPLKGNEAVIGVNLLTAPSSFLGSDVVRAQRTGRITVTGPLELIQGGLGVVIRKPLPQADAGPARLVGIVMNIAPLLAKAGIDKDGVQDIRLALRSESGKVFFGSPTVFDQRPVTHRIKLPDGAWEIGGCPRQSWHSFLGTPLPVFYASGAAMILLFCLLVFVLAHSRANLKETVRKRTDELRRELTARQQTQELFRLITENVADLVAVIDLDGRRIYNSPSYRTLLGDPETLRGSSSFDQIHPDDRDRVRRMFQETVRTGDGQRMKYRMVAQGGQVRHIESQGSVIRDEQGQVSKVIVVSRDVTEQQRTEETLRESELKYRDLVERANSIILHWNPEGRIVFLNEFGQRFFGYSAEEVVGRHVMDTIVPPSESGGRDLHRLMEQICADPVAFEQNVNENMKRGGERAWVAWTNRIVRDQQGRLTGIMSVGTDITARKRADEEIRRLHEDLRRHAEQLERRVAERTAELAVAKERAEAADRIKSAFLATMSHELRTPLNSIIGFTGIILQGLAGPLNAEQSKQLEMVRGSARHLLALINDVLDISKIEAAQLEVVREPVAVRAVVAKISGIVQPLATIKGLALRVALAPGVGTVVGDQRRVEQVLLNLLNNAIKFTERGGVTLRVWQDAAEPGNEKSGRRPAAVSRLHFQVSDTGIGIKPEDMATLFQPFRQIDTGLTRQHDGTGLGLAICRRLADLMGGEISVESDWGRGSTFTFTLPSLEPPALLPPENAKDRAP